MSAAPFQWMTLVGCVIIIPLIVLALWGRVLTWQIAGLLLFIATMYLVFYVWYFFIAAPNEYAWLSAAMRTAEIFGAIGSMGFLVWRGREAIVTRWTQLFR